MWFTISPGLEGKGKIRPIFKFIFHILLSSVLDLNNEGTTITRMLKPKWIIFMKCIFRAYSVINQSRSWAPCCIYISWLPELLENLRKRKASFQILKLGKWCPSEDHTSSYLVHSKISIAYYGGFLFWQPGGRTYQIVALRQGRMLKWIQESDEKWQIPKI